MDKLEMKAKRQFILKQIDAQELKRCAKCHHDTPGSGDIHCGCHAAKKIKQLGDQLITLSSESRKRKMNSIVKRVNAEGLTQNDYRLLREMGMPVDMILKISSMTASDFSDWRKRSNDGYTETAAERVARRGITIEGYKQLKKSGLNDKEIESRYDLFENDIYKFKLTQKIKTRRGKPPRSDEDLAYIDRASKNGIVKETYLNRVKKGMSKEEACTRKVYKVANPLTVKKYNELKNSGLNDNRIAYLCDISISVLNRFKKKNGLVIPYAKTGGKA